jgi:hypothetical protein
MNLSGEDSFGQPHHQLKKLSLVDSVHASLQFSKLKIHPLNRITMIRLTSQMKRYYSSLNRLNWMNNPSDAQSQLKKRVQNQNLVKTYKFRPARYNEFIRAYQDNNKPPLNK